MKELRQEVIKWLREKFGDAVYDDLCCKKSIEEVADYFLENHSADEIEYLGGLDYALANWTEEFVPAKEMESMHTEREIEMLQANALASWQGLPPIYSEEDFDEA